MSYIDSVDLAEPDLRSGILTFLNGFRGQLQCYNWLAPLRAWEIQL